MDQDSLNYKIELWRLESLLDTYKTTRANAGKGTPSSYINGIISTLEWAVETLKVPPDFEQQLEKAQQEAEYANEELRQLKVEIENGETITV